ncbi:hypothetical protein AQUCO_00900400v1 [Aquilegia coerulea]|uniref:Uncharacterized protein n=1 Tax=Aquilegia coerulea TaxID=218851 RepID=A0A2G5EDE7_AQUCA|nr:hypothetical protein AQUCO_00900400v1 [Aquilegia coerulea]
MMLFDCGPERQKQRKKTEARKREVWVGDLVCCDEDLDELSETHYQFIFIFIKSQIFQPKTILLLLGFLLYLCFLTDHRQCSLLVATT